MNTSQIIRFAACLLILASGTAMAAEAQAGPGAAQDGALAAARTGINPTRTEVDPKALDRAQQKFALALKLTHRFDVQAKADGLGNDHWRNELLANLMRIDEGDFAAVASATAVNDALGTSTRIAGVAKPPGTANTLGDATQDLTYIPINPCRILDTRKGSGTSFSAGQTRTYFFSSGNTGADNCNPTPYGAYNGTQRPKAIAANVTVDETGMSGFAVGSFLAIYPQGGTAGTSFMNFGPGDVLANAGVFSINETNGQFNVLASAPAQVIIDVFGVFVPPAPTELECTYATTNATVAANSNYYSLFSPNCPVGYAHTGGSCTSDYSLAYVYNNNQTGTASECSFHNYGGSSADISSSATCCRVPGRN